MLSAHDLADLRASGISDDMIAKCGFRTCTDAPTLRSMMRWKANAAIVTPALVIPFFDINGNKLPELRSQSRDAYCRIKPARAREQKPKDPHAAFLAQIEIDSGRAKAKRVKYESPAGIENRIYFPPGFAEILHADPSAPILITEGEKKAIKAVQEGFACVALVGVYGWAKKRQRHPKTDEPIGEFKLADDILRVPWAGRRAFIVFDSDAAQNENVVRAERRLGDALKKIGVAPRIVRLPGQQDASGNAVKVGLDDFLVAHPADSLRELMESAPLATPDVIDEWVNRPVDPTPPSCIFGDLKSQLTPPVEPAPSPNPLTLPCPTPKGILQEQVGGDDARVIWRDCARLSCPICSCKKKHLWRCAIRKHIGEFARNHPGEPLYLFHVESKKQFKAAYEYMGPGNVSFFRINMNGDWYCRVIATRHPGPAAADVEEITPDAAIARMIAAVDQLPRLDIKAFTSSRDWPVFVIREKDKKKWRKRSSVCADRPSVLSVIQSRHIATSFVSSKPNVTWQWHGVQFSRVESDVDWEHFAKEIVLGQVLPEWYTPGYEPVHDGVTFTVW